MIFYFTGTGNSEYVAKSMSNALGDECLFIPEVLDLKDTYKLKQGERLGFVFPVYSWGIPEFIIDFIKQIKVDGVSYVYFVCTCGDDTGRTKEQFVAIAGTKGWTVQLGYAIQMPNTYVCLPGFDVDSKDVVCKKTQNAATRLHEIIQHVQRYDVNIFDTLPGTMPWFKSSVIRPVFNKVLITSKFFHTNDSCIKCRKCVTECPMHNIYFDEQQSKICWHDCCVGCLRCYHICPTNSVQFGAFTKGKGQYCCLK